MILLDTHAWLWWLSDPGRLGRAAAERIELAKRDDRIIVSAISVWEAALLVKKGRLELAIGMTALVRGCFALSFFRFEAIDPSIALGAVELSPLHPDPADRLIVATALRLGVPLVTKDSRIQASGLVEAIW